MSRSKWNLEGLVLVEGGKLENPEKDPQSKVRTNNKVNQHDTMRESYPCHRDGTRVHFHCAIHALPQFR